MQVAGHALSRTDVGRLTAIVMALLGLLFFYQPWVSGVAPGTTQVRGVTGVQLASGAAAAGRDGLGSSTGTGAGQLTLPTRIPTFAAPGLGTVGAGAGTSAGATNANGGRVATAPAVGLPTTAPSTSGSTSSGGLVLPTRVPTAGAGSGVALATQAAATAFAVGTLQAGGGRVVTTQVTTQAKEHLPTTVLYGVPIAALGIAIFTAIWGRLSDPRDRRFSMLWTALFSVGGTFGLGYLLAKLVTVGRPNDLLGPGEVRGTQWGLWGAFLAFLLALVGLVIAWLSPEARALGREDVRRRPAAVSPLEPLEVP